MEGGGGDCQRVTRDVANGLGILSKLVWNAKLFLMEKLVFGRVAYIEDRQSFAWQN